MKDVLIPIIGTTRYDEIAKGRGGGYAEMDVMEGLLIEGGSGGLELRCTKIR